jgi:hypothetical protein
MATFGQRTGFVRELLSMRRQNLLAGCYRGHPTQANLRPQGRANVSSHGVECGGGLYAAACAAAATTGARNFQWALSPLLRGRTE